MYNKRKKWFECVKKIMRLFIKETKFTYLGEELGERGIVLSNHEGTAAPLAFELYSKKNIKFWSAVEMNSGLVRMYKYQSRVFYHEKKHWNLFLARLFCLIASPLTNMFYKGLQLISIHKGVQFKQTINETIECLQRGQNIVIFPEISDKGYLKELEGYHEGFVLLLQYCLKKEINAPIFVAYYQKDKKEYIIDKPIYTFELLKRKRSKEEIAEELCKRCNELGKM